MNFTLEKYRLFPYVAWSLVISFGLFTFLLTVQLTETVDKFDKMSESMLLTLEDEV